MKKKPFLTDVKTLRARARKHIEQGAVTASYKADRATVIKLLNDALATEIVCVLRYRRHHFMAAGINADAVAAEFLTHANEEQGTPTRSRRGSCSSRASPTSTPRACSRAATPST